MSIAPLYNRRNTPVLPGREQATQQVTISLTLNLPAGVSEKSVAEFAAAVRGQAARRFGTLPAARVFNNRTQGVVSPNAPARLDAARRYAHSQQALARVPGSPLTATEDSLVIDFTGRRVRLSGAPVNLAHKEFEILAFLLRNARSTVSREDILANVWQGADTSVGIRTIDVHIRRLRAKLGTYRELISTVRGRGYRYDPSSDVTVIGI
ncbi:winged helix-turn-helix domain-containing protein [Dermabacteraceae bacterium P7054]